MITTILALITGQDPSSLPVDVTTDEAVAAFAKLLGGLKGAGALGVALAVVQAVMYFFRTPLANFAGKWRLLIVSVLSLVVTYLGLVSAGAPWLASLIAGPVIAGLQVLGNQAWKQFATKAS